MQMAMCNFGIEIYSMLQVVKLLFLIYNEKTINWN